MFIGHHAAAFAGKGIAPRVSLGTLIAAATFLDLLWPIFLLVGIEHVAIDPGNTAFTPLDFYDYPITHSLAMVLVWSVLFAVAYFALRRDKRGAVVCGLAVLSHWVLDFITHRPDLPLWPGGPVVGLGLWQSRVATNVVEVAFFIGALAIYLRTTRARDRIGSIALLALAGFLAMIHVANQLSPPPPNVTAIAWTALAAWLFVPWGWWIDRHREARV